MTCGDALVTISEPCSVSQTNSTNLVKKKTAPRGIAETPNQRSPRRKLKKTKTLSDLLETARHRAKQVGVGNGGGKSKPTRRKKGRKPPTKRKRRKAKERRRESGRDLNPWS